MLAAIDVGSPLFPWSGHQLLERSGGDRLCHANDLHLWRNVVRALDLSECQFCGTPLGRSPFC
jgi:hypothetical protein